MATLNTQNSYEQLGGLSQTVALTGVLAGDMLVLTLMERDASAEPTVSDSINGSWGASVVTRNATAARTSIFRFANAAAGNPTITVDYGSGSYVFRGVAAAFTPAASATLASDQTNSAGMTSTAHNSGSITAGTGFIVACSGHGSDSGGETIGDGMTAFTMVAGEKEYHRYKLTTGETMDADYTTVNSIAGGHVIASFLETGGGGGGALTWLPTNISVAGRLASVVASGMTPRGSGA